MVLTPSECADRVGAFKAATSLPHSERHTHASRFLVPLLLLFALPLAAAVRHDIDPATAFVTFTVPHFLLDEAAGSFADVRGTLVVDPDPAKCSVRVVVQAASIDTNVDARDQHLRSADFFDVAKYPEIVFTST